MEISKIQARMVLDSRGYPTVEADVYLNSGELGRAIVPSGASTGKFEALELRDAAKPYLGKGVNRAVQNINTLIAPKLLGMDPRLQQVLDQIMLDLDGTDNKSKLGANAILAVSMALARAAAQLEKKPLFAYLNQAFFSHLKPSLPRPMMNILNGGVHASNNLDIQEFMLIPNATRYAFPEMLQMGAEVFHHLKNLLKKKNLSTSVGDEGGFAPNLNNHTEALDLLMQAIETAGYRAGEDLSLGLDCAASEFFDGRTYNLSDQGKLEAGAWLEVLSKWSKHYPLISIEDGFAEDDWPAWKMATETLGSQLQLVGDDLFVTQTQRLSKGIAEKTANAILIKLNQVGTLSETIETLRLAEKAGYNTVISHRSGETEDTFIADLAVASAVGLGQIKTGSLCRTDRVAKYNQLLRIAELS
ncbi:MAG: phosphopyruvate hydratase [Gammaproteobacteria bacterium]